MRVAVVVVTWNALGLTRRCLQSLRDQQVPAGTQVQLVVVDNGSQDGTAAALRDEPDVLLVALPDNRGFGGGVNAALRVTSSDVVVLLNNDAVAEPGFLAHLVAPFGAGTPRLGATTGLVLLSGSFVPAGPGGPALVGHDGRSWTRAEHGVRLVNSTGNELTRSGNGRDRDWLRPAGSVSAAPEVFGFNGGCAALSRAALDDVGGFAEPLFMYYEDTELSWRLRRRGWDVQHVPEAVTLHDHAASSGTASAFFLDHNERNRILVCLIHAPWAVTLRALARTAVRVTVGPQRGRRARALLGALARAPWALRRRWAVDRTATVARGVPAALLVPDGAGS
ncbi:glycosyltransferase family 2 protein [Cellulomonas sp. SG140]|uniref:glycosyltransferase family 2 protein n=1 Tax=Cellulomonas sp. SG140 TaxID=2976536 RepID=UPI0021E7A946|nr:glycosyltransferase family 2 protein [Cellulomonas sp. SG140]